MTNSVVPVLMLEAKRRLPGARDPHNTGDPHLQEGAAAGSIVAVDLCSGSY